MKNRSTYAFVIVTAVLAVITFSCSQTPKCWGDDENEGIITGSVNIPCEANNGAAEIIIDSDSAYKASYPKDCNLPTVDFSESTLLGIRTTFGCNAKFIRKVTMKENENRVHYKLTVRECGACKRLGMAFNYVIIPKLPQGWIVTFQVEKK